MVENVETIYPVSVPGIKWASLYLCECHGKMWYPELEIYLSNSRNLPFIPRKDTRNKIPDYC